MNYKILPNLLEVLEKCNCELLGFENSLIDKLLKRDELTERTMKEFGGFNSDIFIMGDVNFGEIQGKFQIPKESLEEIL